MWQWRAKRKSDGALLVKMSITLEYCDEKGVAARMSDVEETNAHKIQDSEEVTIPGRFPAQILANKGLV